MTWRTVPILAVVLAMLVGPTTEVRTAAAAATSCAGGGLEEATAGQQEISRNGGPVLKSPLWDGSSVPIVMVHGWTGDSTAFTAPIDLSASKVGTTEVGRSLVGQLIDVGGTTVYTFDYHERSARWVTDAAIGPSLADAITCLANEHGHAVIVVAHSMGGLATRLALAQIAAENPSNALSDFVSDVVTFGTPNSGSWLASLTNAAMTVTGAMEVIPGLTEANAPTLRGILVLCGSAATVSLDESGICAALTPQIRSLDSQAGVALSIGSPELRALARWPADVRVHALAGSIDVEVTRMAWFNLTTTSLGSIQVGDFVVSSTSAMENTAAASDVSCSYTLDPIAAIADNHLAVNLRVRAIDETRDWVYTGIGSSACFHGNLMRSIELTNHALGVVADVVDDLNSWQITFDGIGPITVDSMSWSDAGEIDGFSGNVFSAPGAGHCAFGGWYDTGSEFDGLAVLAEGPGDSPGTIDVVRVGADSRTGIAAEIPVRTDQGISLGSAEADVHAAYPAAEVSPLEVNPAYTQYVVDSGVGRGMRVVVFEGQVTDISVGNMPQVIWPEGCL